MGGQSRENCQDGYENVRKQHVYIRGLYALNDDDLSQNKDFGFKQLNEEIRKIGMSRKILVIADLNGRKEKGGRKIRRHM